MTTESNVPLGRSEVPRQQVNVCSAVFGLDPLHEQRENELRKREEAQRAREADFQKDLDAGPWNMMVCTHCGVYVEGQLVASKDGRCHCGTNGVSSDPECAVAAGPLYSKYSDWFGRWVMRDGAIAPCRICKGMKYILFNPNTGRFKPMERVS